MNDQEFMDTVAARLKQFGVESDEQTIRYCWSMSNARITNFLNASDVPDGLKTEQAEEVAGEVLKLLYSLGRIESVESVISSVKEGDTTVNFNAANDPTAKFNALVDGMRVSTGSLVRYRRLTW